MRQVLDRYRCTPCTVGVVRSADRRLAATLWERGVPLERVETALLLAAARRNARPRDLPPLPPVRSLHYFLPVVDELSATPALADYKRHLTDTLDPQSQAGNVIDGNHRHDHDPGVP